jgi:hypothetical protein
MLPERPDQIPSEQEIASVTADGAFDPGPRPSKAELILKFNSTTAFTPQVP